MGAQTARAISELLAAAINGGEISKALELWEQDCTLISRDGSQVKGREEIAAILQSLISNGVTLEIQLSSLHQTSSTAVARGTLTTRVQGADGEPFIQRSESLVIYRRGGDGCWRVAIDFPWGMPASDPPAG
jgi:uncharacterized protein (TIGR02246 family)